MANHGMYLQQERVYRGVIKGKIPKNIIAEVNHFLSALPEPLIGNAPGVHGVRREWLFAGRDYSYGRNKRTVKPSGPFSRCEAFIEPIVQALGLQKPNAMLLVNYPLGTNGLSAHRDDEEAHATDQVITLCFGAPATIYLTDNSTTRRYSDFVMNDGEFYVFQNQEHFKHGVEKIPRTAGGRWAFTYRVFKEQHVKRTSPLLATPTNFTPPSHLKITALHQNTVVKSDSYTASFPALGDSGKENSVKSVHRNESPTTTFSGVLKSPAVTKIVPTSSVSPFISPIGHGTRLGTVAKRWCQEQKFDPKVTAFPVNPDPKIVRKINSMQNNKLTQSTKLSKTKSKCLPGTAEEKPIAKITETPKIENKKSNSHQNRQNTAKNTKTINQINKKASFKIETRVVTPSNKQNNISKTKESKKESPVNVKSNSSEKLNSNNQKISTKQKKVRINSNENKEKSPVNVKQNEPKDKLTVNSESDVKSPVKKIVNIESAEVKEPKNKKSVKIANENDATNIVKGTDPKPGIKHKQTVRKNKQTNNDREDKPRNKNHTPGKNPKEQISTDQNSPEKDDTGSKNKINVEVDKLKFLLNLKPAMTSTPISDERSKLKEKPKTKTEKSAKKSSGSPGDSPKSKTKENQNKIENELRKLIINSPKKPEKKVKNKKSSNSPKTKTESKNETKNSAENINEGNKNKPSDDKQNKPPETASKKVTLANGTDNSSDINESGNDSQSYCKNVRNDNILSVTLPMREIPQCTEKDCERKLFGRSYNRVINSWKLHYLVEHEINIETVEFLCSLCGRYSKSKPKLHSCFKDRTYYAVTQPTLKHNCTTCGGSFMTESQQAKHRCDIILHQNRRREKDTESNEDTNTNKNTSPQSNNTQTNILVKETQIEETQPQNTSENISSADSTKLTVNLNSDNESSDDSNKLIIDESVVESDNEIISNSNSPDNITTLNSIETEEENILEITNANNSENSEVSQSDILVINTQTSTIDDHNSNIDINVIPESQTDNRELENSADSTPEIQNDIISQEIFNSQPQDDNSLNDTSHNNSRENEPGCFRRQNIGNPAQPRMAPGTVCRIGDTVHVVFPFNEVIRCPETACMLPIVQEHWPDAQLSLVRHIKNKHDMQNINVKKWCGTCNCEVTTYKISKHRCFRDGYFNPNLDDLNLEYQCNHVNCKRSYPTQVGLDNHIRNHTRTRIKEKNKTINLKEYIKNKKTIIQDTDEPQITQNSQHVDTQNTNNTQESTQQDELGASMIPPTQNEVHNNNTQPLEIADDEDSETSPSSEFMEKFHRILEGSELDKWDEFIDIIEEYISFAQNHVKLPPPRDPTGSEQKNIAKDPRLIQPAYKRNRRRAIRDVLGEVRKPCKIDPNTMAEHFFRNEPFVRSSDAFCDLPRADSEVDVESFPSAEIWTRLCKAENTSPGSDRLTYAHWKSVDPEAKTLAAIFNICLKYGRVPPIWKTSRTIFIPKRGEGNEPADWRPISLCSTISKLFTGCLAKRLTNWAVENKTLSSAQKGFMPFDGAFENNYVLEQTIQAARKSNKEICFASIDLTNAFGSAPHEIIVESLEKTGAGVKTTNLVSNILENINTYTVTDAGTSEPRFITRGVRQGDPLSGILFNFGVDRLVRALTNVGLGINVLAFADDILITAPNADALQVALDTLSVVCSEIGLTVNSSKCYSMHLGVNPRRNLDTMFYINQNAIVTMTDGDPHTFLGKPVGYNIFKDHLQMQEFYETGTAIIESKLTPWQKLDALKSFFYPSLAYAQRTNQVAKDQWRELDGELRRGIKKTIFDLPSRAANEYLYGHTGDSLMGIPLAADDHDIAHIDGAFKLLTSNDETVAELAWKDLGSQVAARNRGRTVTFRDCEDYLSGERLQGTNPNESIFSRARMASARQGVTWHIRADQTLSITIGSTVIVDRRKIFRTIRDHIRKTYTNTLKNKRNQGKTLPCLSKAKVSTHYVRNGDFIRFADWRFIHRARLNLHSLNGAKHTNSTEEKKCRRCRGDFEGLPHVLCHCMHNMQMITDRHNAIVKRVRTAATKRWSILRENQPTMGTALRPDLVLAKDDSLLILDVAVTFENGPDAFDTVRDIKIKKYTPLVELYKNRYSDVKVVAVVVGALGGWDPKNDRVLSRICSKKYSKLMRKLIVSETVKNSRDIFSYHIHGKTNINNVNHANEPGTIALNTINEINEINNSSTDIEDHNNQNTSQVAQLEPLVTLTSSDSFRIQETQTANRIQLVTDLIDEIGNSLSDGSEISQIMTSSETSTTTVTTLTVTTPTETETKKGRRSRIPVAISQTKKPLNIDFCAVQIPQELVVPDADGARMSASKSFSQTTVNKIIRTFNVMVVASPKKQACLIQEDFLPMDVSGNQSMPQDNVNTVQNPGETTSPPRTLCGEPISATDISGQNHGITEEDSCEDVCNISSVCNAVVYKSV